MNTSSSQLEGNRIPAHLYIIINYFMFFFHDWLLPNPFPPKWQRSNYSLACVNKKSRPGILHVLEQRACGCGHSHLARVWRVVSSLSAITKQKQAQGKWKELPDSFFALR